MNRRPIPNSNQITAFMHCSLCLNELPVGESPRSYAAIEVGWTDMGIQAWCKRHEVNIAHVDFMGQKVDLNNTRIARPEDKQ